MIRLGMLVLAAAVVIAFMAALLFVLTPSGF